MIYWGFVGQRKCVAWLFAFAVAAGCGKGGPDIAPVKGRVTLDGRPLANVNVEFQPDDMKPPSTSGTNENGEYQLIYKRGMEGARLGHHRVRITARSGSNPPVIPDRYNTQSELQADVKSGQNEINFDLKSAAK